MSVELLAIAATKGRLIGVDFGDARTGIAVSDTSRLLASGIGNITPGGIEKTADAIAALVREHGAVGVVVGLPVNMDGTEGARAAKCRKLGDLLRMRLGEDFPVAMYDERMTTMTAARYLNETNTRGKKRKGVIDTLSAQIILQNTLDRLKHL